MGVPHRVIGAQICGYGGGTTQRGASRLRAATGNTTTTQYSRSSTFVGCETAFHPINNAEHDRELEIPDLLHGDSTRPLHRQRPQLFKEMAGLRAASGTKVRVRRDATNRRRKALLRRRGDSCARAQAPQGRRRRDHSGESQPSLTPWRRRRIRVPTSTPTSRYLRRARFM
jgi:hypothetical protein